MPSPLIAALRLRKLTLTAIARMIHPDRGPDTTLTDEAVRSYLPHLSRHINGHEPIHRNIRGTKVLNPTWRSLKRVLTGAEFDAALEFAEKQSVQQVHPVQTVQKTRTTDLTPTQQTATIAPL